MALFSGKPLWGGVFILLYLACVASLAAPEGTDATAPRELVAQGQDARSDAKEADSASQVNNEGLTNNVRSGIVVRQAPTRGRVFIAAEGRKEDEQPAKNVRVELREKDSDKVLDKAQTDEQGYFDLAQQPPDTYRLLVGGLTIQLIVEPELPNIDDLPKVVIFVLPRKMAQTAPR